MKYSGYDSMRLKTETSNDVNIRYLVTYYFFHSQRLELKVYCCECEGSNSSYHSPACDTHSCTGVVDKVEAESPHHALIIYNLVKILSCQPPILTAVHKLDTDITLQAA